MVVHREGGVEFNFVDCRVVRWDSHAAYRGGLHKLPPTKAVDFVVHLVEDRVALLEVKDFRGHRIENRNRLASDRLPAEVAEKVRDTLAGLIWSRGRDSSDGELDALVRSAFRPGREKILVVLWLDEDLLADPGMADALGGKIRSLLRPYLLADVVVASLQLQATTSVARKLPWLTGRSVKRDGTDA